MPGPWPYHSEITDVVSAFTIPFKPPAPAFIATLSYQGNVTTLPALIDTGASMTAIPISVANDLAFRKISETPMGTAIRSGGPKVKYPIYAATLSFLDFTFENHPMVALDRDRYMLIGRDILNRLRATFDGPGHLFNLDNY